MRQKQGFQPKLGCLTASCYPFFIIKNLIVLIQYVALLNTQKAFDTVWSHCLMYKCHCLEVSGRLWSLIDVCHTNTSCSCCSKLNKLLLVPISQGVLQGGIMSIFLYLLFIDDRLQEIQNQCPSMDIYSITSSNPTLADITSFIALSPAAIQNILITALKYSHHSF